MNPFDVNQLKLSHKITNYNQYIYLRTNSIKSLKNPGIQSNISPEPRTKEINLFMHSGMPVSHTYPGIIWFRSGLSETLGFKTVPAEGEMIKKHARRISRDNAGGIRSKRTTHESNIPFYVVTIGKLKRGQIAWEAFSNDYVEWIIFVELGWKIWLCDYITTYHKGSN